MSDDLMENQVRMRALSEAAVVEFERVYPQTYSAVWRVEPYAVLGDDLPVSAGVIIDKTHKQFAIKTMIQSMLSRENTEEKREDGCTYRYISICVEGVFVLLLRSAQLLVVKDGEGHETRVTDNVIESIYRFREGEWRHLWGERFFLEHEL
jgi:hypothetical protein